MFLPTEAIQHQRESCSVKESRDLTTELQKTKQLWIFAWGWSSYTGLRIGYRKSSIRHGKLIVNWPKEVCRNFSQLCSVHLLAFCLCMAAYVHDCLSVNLSTRLSVNQLTSIYLYSLSNSLSVSPIWVSRQI